ncbi:MAG TPA: carboxypeptidase-like regulatory domain-containing protein [Longimicrobiaceae bacterium]|nr:carboxypeptidase-like regulatory domain-containing protein [Longimicrobiaceae bacterium]
MRSMILMVGAILLMGACSSLLFDGGNYGEIRVEAVTASGDPVEGLPLTLYQATRPIAYAATDENGLYAFEFVPFGNHGVRAGALEGYTFTSPSFDDGLIIGDSGGEAEVVFTLRRCEGTIRVLVADELGEPVPNAGLVLYGGGAGLNRPAETLADGTAEFTEVPCGEYGVAIDPPAGFTVREGRGSSYIDAIVIEEFDDVQITFTVQRT